MLLQNLFHCNFTMKPPFWLSFDHYITLQKPYKTLHFGELIENQAVGNCHSVVIRWSLGCHSIVIQ
jgi:hypothetical protein